MKVMVVSNMAQSLVNFRGPLLRALVAAGHEVIAAAPEREDAAIDTLAGMGIRYAAAPVARTAIDPFNDLAYVSRLQRIMRRERPDVLLAYTIKPVVYGALAAKFAAVPRRVGLVEGLGYTFGSDTLRQRVVGVVARLLYRLAGSLLTKMIFLNPDDRREFLDRRLVAADKTMVVAGTGIDLDRYGPCPPALAGPVFLLIARLIRDKGVVDFVDAAREVKRQHPDARFRILGPYDDAPGAIDPATVAAWEAEGMVEYLGTTDDVRPVLGAASVFVLPSTYREGVPRTSMEALATARPVITTDAPGCRETVAHGENGYLVPGNDPAALAEAMSRFAQEPDLIRSMGAASRDLACRRFDVRLVNADMFDALGLGAEA